MSAYPIPLLTNPPYVFIPVIESSQNLPSAPSLPLSSRVAQAASRGLELVKILFISFGQSAWETMSYSWIGFKIKVLGYYGNLADFSPPLSLPMGVFRIFDWALGLCQNFLFNTGTFFVRQAFPYQADQFRSGLLLSYAKGWDIQHLRCLDETIDISHVPVSIQVKDLLTMFDEANFEDRNSPGYVKPEGEIDELRQQLESFVNKVNNRVPFLGTPPAEKVPQLLQFYQYIEDAVRFCIHKVYQDLEEFKTTREGNFDTYSEEDKEIYKNLRENQARLALDFAVAGGACGARFMGVASTAYAQFSQKEGTGAQSLEDQLVDMLAQKRKEIALEEIARVTQDTHFYSAYMANMGSILSLPGTKNMVEHLFSHFDVHQYLASFCLVYDETSIIETVNQKFKTSGSFREAFFDWIKNQVKNWNEDHYNQLVSSRCDQVKVILQKQVTAPSIVRHIDLFLKKVDEVRKQNLLPIAANWPLFSAKFFALDVMKECNERFVYQSQLSSLTPECQSHLYEHINNGTPLDLTPFLDQMIRQQKISELRVVIPRLDREQGERLLGGSLDVESFLKDIGTQDRSSSFLEAFFEDGEDFTKKDLPKEVMEWLLVSHKILLPQLKLESAESSVLNANPRIQAEYSDLFIRSLSFDLSDFRAASFLRMRTAGLTSEPEILGLRYIPNQEVFERDYLRKIFEKVFNHDPEKVMEVASQVANSHYPIYPLWKGRVLKEVHSFISSKVVRIASEIVWWLFKVFLLIFNNSKLDEVVVELHQKAVAVLLPAVINHTPVVVIRTANRLFKTIDALQGQWIPGLVFFWIIRKLVLALPRMPFISNLFIRTSGSDLLMFFVKLKLSQIFPQNHLSKAQKIFKLSVNLVIDQFVYFIFSCLQQEVLQITEKEMERQKLLNKPLTFNLFLQVFSKTK